MVNGDDDQSPGGTPSQPTPAETGPSLDTTGAGGVSGLGDGWGTGSASVDEVFENVKAVFQGMQGEILKAWLAIVAVLFLAESAEVFIYTMVEMTGALGGLIAIFAWPIAALLYFLSIVASAAQLTLFGPLRDKVFHGIEPDGWMEAFRAQSGRFLSVLGAVAALTFVIPCTCVLPGLALAFFGCMAPYIAATEEIGVFDAFKKSYERAKSYWQVLVITIGALIGAGLLLGCFASAGNFVAGMLPDVLQIFVHHYAYWVGMVVFQFLIFVVWGGVFVTVDAAESGQAVRR